MLGFGGGFTGLVMLIMAGYIISSGYERLYLVTEPKDKYGLPAITLIVMLLVLSVLQALLSGLIIRELPFALF